MDGHSECVYIYMGWDVMWIERRKEGMNLDGNALIWMRETTGFTGGVSEPEPVMGWLVVFLF
jgi:hypothetical protein